MNSDRLQDKDFRAGAAPRLAEQDLGSELPRFISRFLIIVGVLVCIFVMFLVFWYAFRVILIGFIGIILAVFLRGLADWFGKLTRLSKAWSLAAVILLLLGGVGASFFFIIPQVTSQIGDLQEKMVSSLDQIRHKISQLPFGQDLIRQIPSLKNYPFLQSGAVAKGVQTVFSMTFRTITEVIVVIFLGLFLSVDPGSLCQRICPAFPHSTAATNPGDFGSDRKYPALVARGHFH